MQHGSLQQWAMNSQTELAKNKPEINFNEEKRKFHED